MKTIEFNKGKDSVQLTGLQPDFVSFTMVIDEFPNSFVVEIPAFKIFFETDSRDKIDALAEKSFNSFFKYWLHSNGLATFRKHLADLGFVENRGRIKGKTNIGRTKEVKTITHQNLVFRD